MSTEGGGTMHALVDEILDLREELESSDGRQGRELTSDGRGGDDHVGEREVGGQGGGGVGRDNERGGDGRVGEREGGEHYCGWLLAGVTAIGLEGLLEVFIHEKCQF